jgi:hypothetical protein
VVGGVPEDGASPPPPPPPPPHEDIINIRDNKYSFFMN